MSAGKRRARRESGSPAGPAGEAQGGGSSVQASGKARGLRTDGGWRFKVGAGLWGLSAVEAYVVFLISKPFPQFFTYSIYS